MTQNDKRSAEERLAIFQERVFRDTLERKLKSLSEEQLEQAADCLEMLSEVQLLQMIANETGGHAEVEKSLEPVSRQISLTLLESPSLTMSAREELIPTKEFQGEGFKLEARPSKRPGLTELRVVGLPDNWKLSTILVDRKPISLVQIINNHMARANTDDIQPALEGHAELDLTIQENS